VYVCGSVSLTRPTRTTQCCSLPIDLGARGRLQHRRRGSDAPGLAALDLHGDVRRGGVRVDRGWDQNHHACGPVRGLSRRAPGATARLFDRRIPDAVIRRAMGVSFLATVVVLVMVLVLLLLEKHEPLAILFEVVSAFSTTGLSTGITPHLGVAAKLLLIVPMLVGRIGPLTAAVALATRVVLVESEVGRRLAPEVLSPAAAELMEQAAGFRDVPWAAHGPALGRSLAELDLPRRYEVTVLGCWRGREAPSRKQRLERPTADYRIESGDTLLLIRRRGCARALSGRRLSIGVVPPSAFIEIASGPSGSSSHELARQLVPKVVGRPIERERPEPPLGVLGRARLVATDRAPTTGRRRSSGHEASATRSNRSRGLIVLSRVGGRARRLLL
jgi:hypothetical protein